MPESELETGLETADSSGHLRKIDLEVLKSHSLRVPSKVSSTSIQGRWESVQETWRQCQV